MSAHIIVLDRVLAHYGPAAREAREGVRGVVASALERVWSGPSGARGGGCAPVLEQSVRAEARNRKYYSAGGSSLRMADTGKA